MNTYSTQTRRERLLDALTVTLVGFTVGSFAVAVAIITGVL